MTRYLDRAFRFTARNAFRNARFFIEYCANVCNPSYRMHPSYLSEQGLIEALRSGKSLIRLGDGEAALMNFNSIHYQEFDPQLRSYLIEIVNRYDTSAPYLLGVPETYLSKSNRELARVGLLYCWLPFKVLYRQSFPKHMKYFDAHLFYRTDSFKKVLEEILEGRKILLVTSFENWQLLMDAGMHEKLDIAFVECKPSQAFHEFDTLLRGVLERVDVGNEGAYRVLASAGPASKALVYELSRRGIASYDLGKGIEAVPGSGRLESLI